jgi:hypothetical protein
MKHAEPTVDHLERIADYETTSVYNFISLRHVLDFFKERGVDLDDVFIEGSYGGSSPTEDDCPVFTWRHPQ